MCTTLKTLNSNFLISAKTTQAGNFARFHPPGSLYSISGYLSVSIYLHHLELSYNHLKLRNGQTSVHFETFRKKGCQQK